MKKISHKKIFVGAAILLGGGLLASCTANFCSEVDQAQMAYPYEQGVTVYVSKDEYNALKSADETKSLIEEQEANHIAGPAYVDKENNVLNENVYKYVPLTKKEDGTIEFTAKKASFLQGTVLSTASKNGYVMPSTKYWASIDNYVLEAATYEAYNSTLEADQKVAYSLGMSAPASFVSTLTASTPTDASAWVVNPYAESDYDGGGEVAQNTRSVLRTFGHLKFSGDGGSIWGYWAKWNSELYKSADPSLGIDNCPTKDFVDFYQSQISSKVNQIRSCIATIEQGTNPGEYNGGYGHYGNNSDWEIDITRKDWGYAWNKGFLEGLLVYPVSWLVDTFAYGMDSALSGVGQIWAIIFVTLIVRGILLLISFRSTMDSQKMQALQPEMAKLQAKYPNSNTNQAEKQRLAQEQMALYRRHKIKPFRQILILILQFPVFICVWSGLQGSAALSTGEFLGMRLSDNINSILFNVSGAWYYNQNGWWTALVLFILMAGTQVMAMLLPRIMAKAQTKKVAKMSANPAQSDTQKQMKWVSIFMMIFTIVMGFMLPSAMGVYWLISGLISMIQTFVTQLIISKSKNKKR